MSKTPALSSADSELKYHLITKYRELISRRYDVVIKNINKAPVKLDPKVAKEIKEFFLEYVYPEPAQRRKLDDAFNELGNFVTNPSLVWGLLGSLPMAILQFGTQLPSAIRAGMKSLEAYTAASGFEAGMLHAAVANDFKDPISDEQFLECLRSIPQDDLLKFINETTIIFTVITDTTLLSKTILIMQDVVRRMRSKPKVYNENQIQAIQLGLDLMERGYEILKPYDDATKHAIMAFVADTEMAFLSEIHGQD